VKFTLSKQVKDAINNNRPVLALESTIIASGMPYPQNKEFYNKAAEICYNLDVVPAAIAIINGIVHVGLDQNQVEHIATEDSVHKISKREIGVCIQRRFSGATTVSSTSHIASIVGINVFSTGGIGGVHKDYQSTLDMSQDLYSLRETPLIVVCSGVKSFLDIEKTIEALETFGVTLLGYKTNTFPLFYSSSSSFSLPFSVDKVEEVVHVFKYNIESGLRSSLLVLNPVPKPDQIPEEIINKIISKSISKMKINKVVGKETTPFLLKDIAKETKNKSLDTNISLALNNVRLGAEIAKCF
tara:strand:- start:1753 stop:2649 length:897 start_codon:yes stop_codon:yes gene_type:complete